MSDATAKLITTTNKKDKLMKLNTKRNFLLAFVSGFFFLVAKAGVDDVATNGVDGFGLMLVVFGGLPMVLALIALGVRLWGEE